MQKAAPDIFKVEDENGMVALYKRVQQSNLSVTFGEVAVSAKFLGHVKAEEAKDVTSFKEIIATHTAESEEAA